MVWIATTAARSRDDGTRLACGATRQVRARIPLCRLPFGAGRVAPAAELVVNTKVPYHGRNYLRLTQCAAGFAGGGAEVWRQTTISTCARSTTTSWSSRCTTTSTTASRTRWSRACNILLERGWTPYDVLTKALVEGMRIVGIDFRDGILFVPEVLLAANAMKAGMAILRPLLAETGAPRLGKMVIGTVKGDIHDIGKNLVSMMMEGAGFEVVDLGINNPVEKYLDALEQQRTPTSSACRRC